MLARKLFWTGGLALAYALIATSADFLVNIVALHNPAGFTPLESALLAVLIGAPATYYLLGQRMDLQRAIAERDRTDAILRQKSDQLASSEERYRLIADASPDLIIRYDTAGRVEYLSPAARNYGWDPDQLDGANVAGSLDPTELMRNQRFLEDLAAGLPVPQGEENVWRARTPSGDLVFFEGRSSAIRSPDGVVIGAVCVLRDVTERRFAAQALEQSEQKLRGLFALAPVGIALTDMDGRYIEFNEAFREICGYADDELKALDYWTLTPAEYEADEATQLELLATTGRYGPYEKEYIRRDGSRIPIRLSGLLLEGTGGETSIWSIVEDISAQRRTEAVLIEARNAAEAATIAKSEFLSNMSHEIRTPLTGVVGFAALLQATASLQPEARRYADHIATSAEALLAVVNDVLDFSKLEAGQMELDTQPFSPTDLLETMADLMRDRAAGKGLELSVVIEDALPTKLRADSSRMRQVLLNLLTNAIKFTDRGSVQIAACYALDTGRLRVEVRDTGAGVPTTLVPRLFQRFTQADASSTRAHGGTGLGLAICKSLIEMMGGDIGFDSKLGEGSTFWFEAPAPIVAEIDAGEHLAVSVEPADLAPLSILVVDDVEVNRELVATLLSPFDVALFEAASGAEAIEAAVERRYDVILMDLQMPGMDGMAATRAIRAKSELNRATPILALSANVLPEQIAACAAAGMDDHVAKPISPGDLLSKIARWTTGRPEASSKRDTAA
jgi:PAS domain S-box-containing protein